MYVVIKIYIIIINILYPIISEVESEDVCPHRETHVIQCLQWCRLTDGGGHQKHIRLSSSLASSQ